MEKDEIFMTAEEAAPYLGCDPQSIRCQAQADPSKLGFPVMVLSTRVKIPRWSFFKFLGIDDPEKVRRASNRTEEEQHD